MQLLLSRVLLSWTFMVAVSAGYAGWDKLETLIVFGDSYTTSAFSTSGDQPSRQNPLGNIGKVKASGPGWVQWLATRYNESDILTYNMAVTASSIDKSLTPSPTNSDLTTQVSEYVRSYMNSLFSKYVHSHSQKGVIPNPDTALFAVWLGINDVTTVVLDGDPSNFLRYDQQYAESIKTYYSELEFWHEMGATNFLIINAPPIQHTPWVMRKAKSRPSLASDTEALVEALNDKIWNMTQMAREKFSDATIYHYDAYNLYNTILNDTDRFPETNGIEEVRNACEAYAKGTPQTNTKSPKCSYAVDQYFWLNKLHPTSTVHQLMAKQIAELLSGPPPY